MICKKKVTALLLMLCILLGMLIGCDVKNKKSEENTLTINMWASAVPLIREALETKFPDINFVINEYAGANTSLYHKELLRRGQGGDLFFYTTFYNDSDAPQYLVDLSGYPFLTNYDKAILSTLDINGAIYQVPGPISVRYIAVNKTLFNEKGWKIPQSFDEMVAVCKQIREEEPNITPLGLGSEGMGFVWTLVTSYSQMGYLDTAEGRLAEQSYRNGTASFGDAFDEGLDMVSQLVDAGAFLPAKFAQVWDVSPRQMGDREAAMCYVMSSNALHTKLFSGQAKGDSEFGKYNGDEFEILPLYGKNPKNKGLILGTTNTWGINKNLEEKGNEKKLKNALRVLEYISSEEGQLSIRSDPATIPAIKNMNADDIPKFIRELWNDSTNSIKTFFLYTGYEHVMVETGKILKQAMIKGDSKGMKEEFISVADKLNDEFIQNHSSPVAFGYVDDNLSVEQTRKICCEAFRETAGADIAIVSEAGEKNGIKNKNGLAGKLFRGDVVSESINMIIALTSTDVVSASLSGKEIRQLLESGKTISDKDGKSECFDYWASGIEISRNKEGIAKITFNGTELNDSEIYKVAMLNGDFPQELADSHEILDTGVVITDSLKNYFMKNGIIKAK